jgi:hypothetical protein
MVVSVVVDRAGLDCLVAGARCGLSEEALEQPLGAVRIAVGEAISRMIHVSSESWR